MSFGLGPVLRLGLHADLVDAAEFVEVVDVGRAQIRLHRGEDVAQRNVEQLHLFAVDVDIQLRHAGAERRVQRGETAIGCRAVFDDARSRLETASFRPTSPRSCTCISKPPRTPRPRIAGGAKGKTIGFLDLAEFAAQVAEHRIERQALLQPLFQGAERDEQRAGVRGRALVEHRQTADRDPVFDARQFSRGSRRFGA